MQPEQYWKAKALELERAILEQSINQAVKAFEDRLVPAFAEAGLDPKQRYTFDDEALAATPVQAQAEAPKPQLVVDNSSEV